MRAFVLIALCACTPKNVSEAEAKADRKWLEDNGSPEAVSALGRLADKDSKAAEWLQSHATTDTSVYIAAWEAAERNATWGPTLLRSALSDPVRADAAASGMKRGSTVLDQFIPDLEGAVTHVEGTRPSTASAVLASVGTSAAAVIERRLKDPKSRGAMCRGIGSADSSAESRALLLKVPADARDDAGCLEAVTNLALADPKIFDWLATSGETGLLRQASQTSGVPCPKLSQLWKTTIEKRPAADHGALAIPLGTAIKRCPPDMDSMLSPLLENESFAPLIISGIDPYDRSTTELRKTCTALERAARNPRIPRRSVERAHDEIAHCSH